MSKQVDEVTAKIVKYYAENDKRITNKYYDLIKWIGTSSLAFLPFFVSLIPRNPLHGWLLGLYIFVVVSIGLGILSVCVLLFCQLRLERKLLIQATKASAEPRQGNNTHEISEVSYPTYYIVSKYVFSISYTVFFFSFIAFCILSAIY